MSLLGDRVLEGRGVLSKKRGDVLVQVLFFLEHYYQIIESNVQPSLLLALLFFGPFFPKFPKKQPVIY